MKYSKLALCTMLFVGSASAQPVKLTDAEIENIVRRSYQYVAMYNVNNKFAMDTTSSYYTGGWNKLLANTALADHELKSIARPNNDTLYFAALLDLVTEPVILECPAFDSKFVSMMATGYDHYVNIPMSTTRGDFGKPSRILFYTERSGRYEGEPVEGVDRIQKMTGDFISVVIRVMPHATEPARLKKNQAAMQAVKAFSLSQFKAGKQGDVPTSGAKFPPYGKTDFDIFENNLLEVMQFVFNHTTFDKSDEIDRKLLAVYRPLGVVPGKTYDPSKVAEIDGKRFRAIAEKVAQQCLADLSDAEFTAKNVTKLFQPKGQMPLNLLVYQSVVGPIGQPASQAVYPSVVTVDGAPMNSRHDYRITMAAKDLPPANAFWSVTLYDSKNGFFIPNDRKKYSVGENAGMKLDADGGIEIHIAADQPDGVPDENWLPVNRGDYGIDVILRVYAPDLERFRAWSPPKAKLISN